MLLLRLTGCGDDDEDAAATARRNPRARKRPMRAPHSGFKRASVRTPRTSSDAASLVTIAVLSVAGFAGCGGDEGLSTEEFIAKADAICQKADKEQAAVGGGKGIYGDNFSDPAFLSSYNAATQDALKRLKALDAPESERKAVSEVLSAVERSVAAIDRQIVALRAKDAPKQSEANRDWIRSYGDIQASAGALGLTQCQTLGN